MGRYIALTMVSSIQRFQTIEIAEQINTQGYRFLLGTMVKTSHMFRSDSNQSIYEYGKVLVNKHELMYINGMHI